MMKFYDDMPAEMSGTWLQITWCSLAACVGWFWLCTES